MSRAKEIQEKLDLQAKLQLSFSNTTSKVLSWLDDKSTDDGKSTQNLCNSKQSFFELPVLQIGSGLNFNLIPEDRKFTDINTIGDFMKNDKKVSSLSKQKRRMDQSSSNNSIYRITKDDTKAMVSLKRKMRQTQRNSKQQEGFTIKASASRQISEYVNQSNKNNTNDDDLSDNDEPRIEKASKKTFGLLFNKPKKGNK